MGMFGMGVGMLLWTALLIALVAAAVVLAVRAVRRSHGSPHGALDGRDDWAAEDQLRMRYARGELDSDEFRERLRELHED